MENVKNMRKHLRIKHSLTSERLHLLGGGREGPGNIKVGPLPAVHPAAEEDLVYHIRHGDELIEDPVFSLRWQFRVVELKIGLDEGREQFVSVVDLHPDVVHNEFDLDHRLVLLKSEVEI